MASVSRLVQAELGRFDWSNLRCGCGNTAGHMPETFKQIAVAESPSDMRGYSLGGHLELETNLFEAAVPAVDVLLAALAGPLSDFARDQFIATLWYIVSGDSHRSEIERGRSRLGDECRLRARSGVWVILHYAVNRRDETALEILESIDLDDERLNYYKSNVVNR